MPRGRVKRTGHCAPEEVDGSCLGACSGGRREIASVDRHSRLWDLDEDRDRAMARGKSCDLESIFLISVGQRVPPVIRCQ